MVEFYSGTHTRQPVPETVKVLLTGDLANDTRVVKLIQEEVDYSVELMTAGAGVFSGLPLHEYAANAGAALINTATVRDKAGAIVPGHQINLGNIARERKTREKKVNIMPRLAVPLAVIAGIGAMIPFYNMRNDLQASLAQAQAELTQANAQYNQALAKANDAKALEDNISEVQANTRKIVSANQAILTRTDFVSDITFIIKALPAGVSYTSISIDAGAISIAGDASTAAPVVQFAHNLEAAGGYAKANISWINKPHAEAAGVGVSFRIVISR
jgi:Tfp pilus assembly protein PilN